jgi:hypothetical protein
MRGMYKYSNDKTDVGQDKLKDKLARDDMNIDKSEVINDEQTLVKAIDTSTVAEEVTKTEKPKVEDIDS